MKLKKETKAYSALRYKGVLGGIVAPLVTVFAIGCVPPSAPQASEPSAQQVFQPDPGTLTDSDGLTLNIQGLDGKTVCYGSNALISADGSSCQFGQESTTGTIDLMACIADQTIKLSFIGNNGTPVSITGTYDTSNYSTCDGDNDGVANNTDNCPDLANTDQADFDNDGAGNACDDDDDNDGVNDGADNCPFAANADQDPDACSGQADADNDLIPDSADNCPNVWNRDQGDDDGDGAGNVCDTTVVIGLPLANDEFVQAFVRWKDQVQCAIRCNDPTGGGNQGTLSCPGGGTANWSVDLQILAGQANSYFTYSGCNFTTAEGDQFTVSGQFAQFSDFDGNGTEQGSVDVGEGDFVGVVEAHTVFSNKSRSGGYFRAGCLSDPLPDQDCLPAPGMVNVYYPDWTCQNDECGTPPPYVDSDGDGVFDRYDNCPNDSNPNQANSDFDNEGGDACDTPEVGDNDGDLIPDSGDNCPNTANQDQLDTDGDGQGDVCDTYPNDVDNDGFSDDVDNCPLISNPTQEDNDNDGEGNECDLIPDVASVLLVTYGRGIGTIPGTSCGDMEEDAGLCYEYCDEGFDGVGPVCWNEREHSYGRGVGTIPDDIWNQTCPSDRENDAGLCYRYCDAGYHGVGPVCWLDTISYGRGAGTIPDFVCDADEDKDAGLCYPKCETGYNGVGPVCWAPMEDILEGLIIDLTETFPFLVDMFQ